MATKGAVTRYTYVSHEQVVAVRQWARQALADGVIDEYAESAPIGDVIKVSPVPPDYVLDQTGDTAGQ